MDDAPNNHDVFDEVRLMQRRRGVSCHCKVFYAPMLSILFGCYCVGGVRDCEIFVIRGWGRGAEKLLSGTRN